MKILFALLLAGSTFLWAPAQSQKGTPPVPTSQNQQARESVLYKVFPKPTGQNGYEEFLRAADLAQTDAFRLFAEYYARLEQEASGADLHGDDGKLIPRPPLPPTVSPDDTLLNVARKWSLAFSAIPDLIHVGCQKSPQDPRSDFNALTTFPELALFRSLVRFLRVVAYADFSDGAPAKATTVLVDSIRFGEALTGPTIIHTLVGFAVQSAALAQVSESLNSLSERDCKSLAFQVDQIMSRPNPAVRAVAGERVFLTNTLADAFKPGDSNPLLELLGNEEVPAIARNLGPNQVQEVKTKLTARLNRTYSAVEAALASPDTEWFKGEALDHALPDSPKVGDVKNLDDLADFLEGTLLPVFSQVQLATARYRTQLRLLKLHTRILSFRWHWKRLPTRLAEAVPQDELQDPYNGTEFQYTPTSTGYRLFSRGFKDTGEIELKYSRVVSTGRNPADPPGFFIGSFEPERKRDFSKSKKKFTELAIFPLN